MVGTFCVKEASEGMSSVVLGDSRSTGRGSDWKQGLGKQSNESRSEDSWSAKMTGDGFEVDTVLFLWRIVGWLEGGVLVWDSLGRLRASSWSLRAPRSFVSMWSFTWDTVHDVSTRVVSHWSVVTGERVRGRA